MIMISWSTWNIYNKEIIPLLDVGDFSKYILLQKEFILDKQIMPEPKYNLCNMQLWTNLVYIILLSTVQALLCFINVFAAYAKIVQIHKPESSWEGHNRGVGELQ